jgi:WD40 repeat protein
LEDDGLVTNDVIFSPDGRYVVTSQDDFNGGTQTHYQVVWDMETGEPVTRFDQHTYFTNGQAFGSDGHTILSGSFAFSPAWETTGLGDIILWDATTGELIHRFDYEATVNHVTLNRSMTLGLAVSSPYQEVTLWDVDTASPTFGQLIKTFKMPNGGFDVKFGADESAFFVATTAGTLQMWDIATGAILKTFTGHDGWVVSLDISPDGQYLLSGGSDGYVILWDIATGEELRRYAGHDAGIWNVAFSPDGRTGFSSSYDGTVIQWQIADWTLQETLTWINKNRYIRDFSCEERQQYRIEPLCE